MTTSAAEGLSVLLVEDNPADARLVTEMLRDVPRGRIAVTRAVRLEEALGRLQAEGYDAVLLDLSLPDSHGIETFAKAHARARNVPIVVLTGLADEELAARAVREGAQDYLVKGYVDGQLIHRAIRYAVERHAADEALRSSESRYRHLIEGSVQGILIHVHGTVRLANLALARLLGLDSPDRLIGGSIWPHVAEEDRDQVIAYASGARDGRPVPEQYEFRIVRADGRVVWVNCVATTLSWEGEPASLTTVVDITERKNAEEDLRRTEERFRHLADNIKEALVVCELPAFTPSYVSRMWADIWGRDLEHACTARDMWSDAVHPDDRAATEAAQRTVLLGEPASTVFRVVRDDGSLRWVRARMFPVSDAQGVPFRMVGLVEDISDIRLAEQQLRQAQKMEAVGRLAGGIAHDFNNLLTAILGYSELITHDLAPDHPSQHDVHAIRTAGESAARLTRQLLAFSRRQILQPQSIDLNEVVGRMDSLLRRVIGSDVILHTELQSPLPNVTADPGQIEQVIMNLAVNARDAMPDGGRLTIETRVAEFDETVMAQHREATVGPHVVIAVSDTGVGMSEAVQKRLFEPYFTTKELGKGTGLGLATVYGIVQQSKGSIWVYSEVGHGSTFKIYLPISDAAVVKTVEPAPQPVVGGAETILVVEDQYDVRAVICETLRRNGYHVLDAADGAEAIELGERHPGTIGLLLTDVIIGAVSGRHIAARLHAARPDLRVIYMSGYTDEAIVRHGVLEPGLAFVQKPFAAHTLLAKVRDVLDAVEPPSV